MRAQNNCCMPRTHNTFTYTHSHIEPKYTQRTLVNFKIKSLIEKSTTTCTRIERIEHTQPGNLVHTNIRVLPSYDMIAKHGRCAYKPYLYTDAQMPNGLRGVVVLAAELGGSFDGVPSRLGVRDAAARGLPGVLEGVGRLSSMRMCVGLCALELVLYTFLWGSVATCKQTSIYMYIYIYIYMHTGAKEVITYIRTYINTYTHIQTYIHTFTLSLSVSLPLFLSHSSFFFCLVVVLVCAR